MPWSNSTFGREHDVLRPDVLGAEVDDPHDARMAVDRGPDLGDVLVRRGFAEQQARHLVGEEDRDDHEQDADREAAGRVPSRLVGDRGHDDAEQRDAEADQRAGVLEQHDRDLG